MANAKKTKGEEPERRSLQEWFDLVPHLSVDVAVKEILSNIDEIGYLKELSTPPFKKALSDYRAKLNQQAKKAQEAREAEQAEQAAGESGTTTEAPLQAKRSRSRETTDVPGPDSFDTEDPFGGTFWNGEKLVRWGDATVADLDGYERFLKEKITALRGGLKALGEIRSIVKKEGVDKVGDSTNERLPDLIKRATIA